MKNRSKKTLDLVLLALFGAIIVLLAATPLGYVPLGVTRATTIHIPVILGSLFLGPKKGAILGALFGLTSLIVNTFAPTVTSFVFSPFYSAGGLGGNPLSLIICFVPRILIGVVPYYIYKLIQTLMKGKKGSQTVGFTAAGLAGSLTNTILVMNLIYVLFGQSYAAAKNIPFETLYGVIMGVIGLNGVPEAIVAAILTVAIGKALSYGVKKSID
jgi:uncharacterized membrane protein